MFNRFLLTIVVLCFGLSTVHADSYYIDPINGSDNNDGSLNSPWESFMNIMSYYSSDFGPPQYVSLQPGDTIFLMDGVHNKVLNPGGKNGPTDGGSYIIYYRSKNGDENNWFSIQAYPGATPVIDADGGALAVMIHQSSHWTLSGITIANSMERGLLLDEISNVQVHDIEIYDTDGLDNNNIAGFYCRGCDDIEIYNSSFYDNYDRNAADTGGQSTENSSNVVFFGGTNTSFHHNTVFNSAPISAAVSGGCLKYKHASTDPQTFFNVHNNRLLNCKHFSIGAGTPNTHVYNNIIEDSSNIVNRDLGGPTHQVNQLYEYNTLFNSGGIALIPTTAWRNQEFPDDPQSIVVRNNIFYDSKPAYNQENGVINIGTYMSDELYNEVFPELTFDENCYYNPNTPIKLNIGAQNGGKYGILGDQYILSGWQELNFDLNSFETDPMFIDPSNGDFQISSNSDCINMGAYANQADLIFTDGFQ